MADIRYVERDAQGRARRIEFLANGGELLVTVRPVGKNGSPKIVSRVCGGSAVHRRSAGYIGKADYRELMQKATAIFAERPQPFKSTAAELPFAPRPSVPEERNYVQPPSGKRTLPKQLVLFQAS